MHPAGAADVNSYLRSATRGPYSAKDFRTWKASAHVAATLYQNRDSQKLYRRRKILGSAIAEAAALLGNTAAVCRKSYIHPQLLESYMQGEFGRFFSGFAPRRRKLLGRDEQILARFLRSQAARGQHELCQ
jgi:DNA topoisomerase-1